MIIWINGAFGAGKTTTAFELHRRISDSFVYDPENFGYFMCKNAPETFSECDFQDYPLWRETNYQILKMLSNGFDGIIIVPMTLVNPIYYNEIVTRLENDGIDIKHFILYASKETVMKRLKSRSFGFIGREGFASNAVDRCIYTFDNHITETKIITDDKDVDEAASEIAEHCGINLLPDNRPQVIKSLSRFLTSVKHIR